MFRKYVFVLVTVLGMVSFSTPASAKATWDVNVDHTSSVEKWTESLRDWLEDEGVQTENASQWVEKARRYFEKIEWNRPESNPPADENPAPTAQEKSQIGKQAVDESPAPTSKSLASDKPGKYEVEVVKLVNEERTERGLEPLEILNRLNGLAAIKSQDMADKNYFSHTSPTYGSPFEMMDQFEFTYRAAGENIAAGQRSPEQVVEAWMNSEGHRANILNENFTHIGVGYVEGSGPYGTYWTQLFMTPR